MILLAALLSFGWPSERTQFGPALHPVPPKWEQVVINKCCGSMRPTLKGGETAYIDRDTSNAQPGDIASDGRALHRIVAITKTGVRLAGDANRQSDPWEPRSNLQYIVRYVVRP